VAHEKRTHPTLVGLIRCAGVPFTCLPFRRRSPLFTLQCDFITMQPLSSLLRFLRPSSSVPKVSCLPFLSIHDQVSPSFPVFLPSLTILLIIQFVVDFLQLSRLKFESPYRGRSHFSSTPPPSSVLSQSSVFNPSSDEDNIQSVRFHTSQ
jgi:hypothetical protein